MVDKQLNDGRENVWNEWEQCAMMGGDFHLLPPKVQRFVAEKAELMRPRGIYICDGSQHEADEIIDKLIERGMLSPLKAYENNYICRTDPKDVARVESKTWMVTPDKYQTVTHTPPGVEPMMGHWLSPQDLSTELDSRFPGCMAGRIMYVIPFSMGPVGGPLSKIGVQLTDSNYVVLSMRIMTRVCNEVWDALGDKDFVRCIHSVGLPRPVKQRVINHWPCNPERVLIAHRPAEREIWSFGSGYGGNSLLGRDEHFIAAAFPSACGKTNLAMLEPTIPGWKVRCVGDDIAWMKFGEDGRLYGINPEAGFFGVAPGTSNKTNPMAVATFQKNSIFTNVGETVDGEYFWEGLEDEIKDKNVDMINWLGQKWRIGDPGVCAHPNSRFAAPASQCPIIHPDWESPKGVPIEAIIFGGRRPAGVPLVYETRSWLHGIFTGACLKSEATAAAEYKGKTVMHDPMAMRPFMGYNFGHYLQHWIDLNQEGRKVPRIYHVNWFRKDANNKFLWPGFGDNIRVIDWIIRRLDGEPDLGVETPIGIVPKKGSINLDGLPDINWDELMSVPSDYWTEDTKEIRHFLEEQVGPDLPKEIRAEMDAQEERINKAAAGQ
ncbi:phosphoenolpyruvate carboxykinase [Ancylostoma ceylanicum]|uniref:Phosphoenolpyruvate carboxykinase [GTP] n=1 Tax=Ancylostoma ceylanicum TaxID=53326 RepID=A0A0D6LHV2_9BILA|nr:phosphoenolpyruvate carboxykinase [Ancylostoma ceylanicum]